MQGSVEQRANNSRGGTKSATHEDGWSLNLPIQTRKLRPHDCRPHDSSYDCVCSGRHEHHGGDASGRKTAVAMSAPQACQWGGRVGIAVATKAQRSGALYVCTTPTDRIGHTCTVPCEHVGGGGDLTVLLVAHDDNCHVLPARSPLGLCLHHSAGCMHSILPPLDQESGRV
jgi:hypothetical protein